MPRIFLTEAQFQRAAIAEAARHPQLFKANLASYLGHELQDILETPRLLEYITSAYHGVDMIHIDGAPSLLLAMKKALQALVDVIRRQPNLRTTGFREPRGQYRLVRRLQHSREAIPHEVGLAEG